tara:strand:+ start:1072 stop:1929 length:858 start_codon:yes stop_codon:yes gene_type:complete
MNVEKLNKLHALSGSELGELRDEIADLVKEYPYSAPFRMLLAKASKEAGHLDMKKDLLAAAAHCSSRKALFDVMFSESLAQQAREIHEEIDLLDAVSEEEFEGLVWHTAGEIDEVIDAEEQQKREDVVEAISYSLEKKSEEILEKNLVGENEVDLWDDNELEIRTGGSANSLFGKWLSKRAIVTKFGDSGRSESRVERGSSVIIDAFLAKDNPKIGKPRDVDSPVLEWANKGLEEDPSLVTETMAKLYAKQGQIGRARKAFKLLALKYPDKSVYFAAQLKKLSKK